MEREKGARDLFQGINALYLIQVQLLRHSYLISPVLHLSLSLLPYQSTEKKNGVRTRDMSNFTTCHLSFRKFKLNAVLIFHVLTFHPLPC